MLRRQPPRTASWRFSGRRGGGRRTETSCCLRLQRLRPVAGKLETAIWAAEAIDSESEAHLCLAGAAGGSSDEATGLMRLSAWLGLGRSGQGPTDRCLPEQQVAELSDIDLHDSQLSEKLHWALTSSGFTAEQSGLSAESWQTYLERTAACLSLSPNPVRPSWRLDFTGPETSDKEEGAQLLTVEDDASEIPNHLQQTFALEEKQRMRQLNTVQGQLFILLKFLLKNYLAEVSQCPGLTSHHVKHLLFYLIEDSRLVELANEMSSGWTSKNQQRGHIARLKAGDGREHDWAWRFACPRPAPSCRFFTRFTSSLPLARTCSRSPMQPPPLTAGRSARGMPISERRRELRGARDSHKRLRRQQCVPELQALGLGIAVDTEELATLATTLQPGAPRLLLEQNGARLLLGSTGCHWTVRQREARERVKEEAGQLLIAASSF
uniref:FAM178 domain-containing protein n=1 Tax=Macrostomum lignano TaxID=282301 RepID=A0A1I8FBG2_9PLAT